VKLKQMNYAGMEASVRVGPLPEVLTDRDCDELLHSVETILTKQRENQSVTKDSVAN